MAYAIGTEGTESSYPVVTGVVYLWEQAVNWGFYKEIPDAAAQPVMEALVHQGLRMNLKRLDMIVANAVGE